MHPQPPRWWSPSRRTARLLVVFHCRRSTRLVWPHRCTAAKEQSRHAPCRTASIRVGPPLRYTGGAVASRSATNPAKKLFDRSHASHLADQELQLAQITQHSVVGTGLDVDEAVTLVEAPRIGVHFVDVDVHLLAAAFANETDRRFQERRADAPIAQCRTNIELLELRQRTVEEVREPERQQSQPDGFLVAFGQENSEVTPFEQPDQPNTELLGRRPRCLEFGVEVEQQATHDSCVGGGGRPNVLSLHRTSIAPGAGQLREKHAAARPFTPSSQVSPILPGMLRLSPRISVLALLVGMTAACSGSGGGTDAAEPTVAAIAGTRPASTDSAAPEDVNARRPFIRHDASEQEITALYTAWTECLIANGAKRGASLKETLVQAERPKDAKAKKMSKACRVKQPESWDEREERTNPSLFKEHNLKMYRCAQKKGYKLTTPDEQTGQFGLTKITALGDFGSPGIVACEKEAFGLK
jgi:hypothetical protein